MRQSDGLGDDLHALHVTEKITVKNYKVCKQNINHVFFLMNLMTSQTICSPEHQVIFW